MGLKRPKKKKRKYGENERKFIDINNLIVFH